MKQARFLLVTFLGAICIDAQSGLLKVTAEVPEGIEADESSLTLFLDGSAKGVPCNAEAESSDDRVTFSCPFVNGSRFGRFRFKSPGFKAYTVNENLRSNGRSSGAGPVDLGKLNLVPSLEPRIEGIDRAHVDANGSVRFRIKINNPLPKEMRITNIRLKGTEKRNCANGVLAEPVYFTLAVSKQLRLSRTAEGAVGLSASLTGGGESVDVSGQGVFNRCGESDFTMSAPTNIPLPPNIYTINLDVPPSGRRSLDWSSILASSDRARAELPMSDVLNEFSDILFILTTSDREFPEIRSHFNRQ